MIYLLCFVGFIFLTAGISDLRSYRIPNWTHIALILAYIIRAVIYPETTDPLKDIGIAVLVFVVMLIPYILKGQGAGDVKLGTVGTLWAGSAFAWDFLIVTAILGGVLAVFVLIFATNKPSRMLEPYVPWLAKRIPALGGLLPASKKIPYGIPLACGGLVTIYHQFEIYLPNVVS